MKVIYKYELKTNTGIHKIELPKGSKFLKAANQYERIQLWFECQRNQEEKETQHFVTFHTGEYLAENPMEYIDTILLNEGDHVEHIYKLI